MDNLDILFYVAFGLIYLASRVLRKKKKAAPPPQSTSAPDTMEKAPRKEPDLTFEDLLKEITGQSTLGKKTKRAPSPEPKPKPLVTKTPEPARAEAVFDDERAKTVYREATLSTEATQDEELKSIDEVEEKPEDARFESYAGKQKENTLADELVEMLRDQHDVKKAIIVSEVLRRKY